MTRLFAAVLLLLYTALPNNAFGRRLYVIVASSSINAARITVDVMDAKVSIIDDGSKRNIIHPAFSKERSILPYAKRYKQYNGKKQQQQQQGGDDHRSDKRRVMPWLSVTILIFILIFFRSFAAPFFDPLVR